MPAAPGDAPLAESRASSRWKSRSSFTSGLLAISTEAQPLNAPSPSAPLRPLIITTEPLSRTSALPDSGLGSRPGASSVRSTGMFCRSSGGAGNAALISNVSGCSPARALPVIADVAVGRRSRRVGADALDAVLDAVAQIGKHHGAVGHRDAIDRERLGVGCRRRTPRAARTACGCALRSRSSGTFSIGRTMTSSVISGWPDHRLASVMSAWMLPTVRRSLLSRSFGSCSVTSFSVTLSDGQTPDPGRARDRQPIAGFALDPRLDRRGQEAGGNPDHQQQPRSRRSRRRRRLPAIFKALMTTFQTGKRHRFRPRVIGRGRWLKLIPEQGNRSKDAKIIRGYCKVM